MQIFVRGAGETHTVSVEDGSTVGSLKSSLAKLEGIPSEDQVLFLGGLPLSEDCVALSALEIQEHSTFDVTSRLLGGKVHGSLARAGKVKGQTPKVDAQEKKKRKTGRAKRRIQYNRRFVNVVAQVGGRKRGPNANPASA